jgi:hypothetical protein
MAIDYLTPAPAQTNNRNNEVLKTPYKNNDFGILKGSGTQMVLLP